MPASPKIQAARAPSPPGPVAGEGRRRTDRHVGLRGRARRAQGRGGSCPRPRPWTPGRRSHREAPEGGRRGRNQNQSSEGAGLAGEKPRPPVGPRRVPGPPTRRRGARFPPSPPRRGVRAGRRGGASCRDVSGGRAAQRPEPRVPPARGRAAGRADAGRERAQAGRFGGSAGPAPGPGLEPGALGTAPSSPGRGPPLLPGSRTGVAGSRPLPSPAGRGAPPSGGPGLGLGPGGGGARSRDPGINSRPGLGLYLVGSLPRAASPSSPPAHAPGQTRPGAAVPSRTGRGAELASPPTRPPARGKPGGASVCLRENGSIGAYLLGGPDLWPEGVREGRWVVAPGEVGGLASGGGTEGPGLTTWPAGWSEGQLGAPPGNPGRRGLCKVRSRWVLCGWFPGSQASQ